ncbi:MULTISPECIES: hypothetical protein [Lysobacteraceae]|uniref:DUF4157 domain-containing protein n=1 Tax=Novilysobacter avium TaxID=2781023 RepID=A0A7S6UKB6_9GAMM|nr:MULTISPECIES: hypothetical protein [Lysobacter]QOW21876.1 hypothetical protein INQ42_11720 [Lysobacter avium]QOW24335.1 hypothetical protein INQ43_11645 [Lysobacter sp. H23M47]
MRIDRFPVRLALLAAVTLALAGCGIRQLARAEALVPDHGGHAVRVLTIGNVGLYDFMSVLPGGAGDRCPLAEASSKRITVGGCGNDAREMLPWLEALLPAIEAYLPEIHVSRLRVSLHRPGSRVLKRGWRSSALDNMTVAMSFRYAPGSERHARYAVRVLAHELTHVAHKRRPLQGESEEYFGALAESCVEYAGFGSTSGYAFETDVKATISDDFNDAQRESATEAQRAYRSVIEFAGDDGTVRQPNTAFEAFCTASIGVSKA